MNEETKKTPRTATESTDEAQPNPGDPGFEQPNNVEGATIGQRQRDSDPAPALPQGS